MSKYAKYLTRELDKVYTDEQQEEIAFYTDTETTSHYIWKFDYISNRHIWSFNKATRTIEKDGWPLK